MNGLMNKYGRQLRSPIRWSLYLRRQPLDPRRRSVSLCCWRRLARSVKRLAQWEKRLTRLAGILLPNALRHINPPTRNYYAIGRRPITLWTTEFSILNPEHRSTPWNCMFSPAPITRHGGQFMEPPRRAGIRCRCSMPSSTSMLFMRGPCGVAITRRNRLRPDQRSRNEHRWACDEAVQHRLFQTFYVKERETMVKTIAIFVYLSFAVAFNANANDSDRINQLEKEIQDIKFRLSKLETFPGNQSKAQEPATSGDGWKSVTNWRKLTPDMSESDVRRILGEPARVDGGGVAIWYYQNKGTVTLISGKLQSWHEPRN